MMKQRGEEAHAIATAVEARQTGENQAKPNLPPRGTLGGFQSPGDAVHGGT